MKSTIRTSVLFFVFSLLALFLSCKKESPAPQPPPAPAPVADPLAAVSTSPVKSITETTASCGGTVFSQGTAALMNVGVCWDTLPGPTTLRAHVSAGAGTGTFVINMTGLTPNTKYYVRSYATNLNGTAYGNEVEFTTLDYPTAIQNLTEKNFRLISATVTPQIAGTNDLYSLIDSCSKDDIIWFGKSGALTLDAGPTKCDPSEPQATNGTWSLLNNDTELKIDLGSVVLHKVLLNNGADLILQFTDSSGGQPYVFTYHYKVI